MNANYALNNNSTDALCQYYLRRLYEEVRYNENMSQNQIVQTSGEILYEGVNKILSSIRLTNQDVFIDFGSGLGKIAIQVFLKTEIKEVIGIEILLEQHQQAIKVAETLKNNLSVFFTDGRKLNFILGDFLTTALASYPTVALINATCFSQSLLLKLGNIINQIPTLHTLFTLRPIENLKHLKFKKTLRVECSWDTALCYLYRK